MSGRPPRESDVDRVQEIVSRAAWHREQLEAQCDELCRIFRYRPGTYGADELMQVVYGNQTLQDALERIQQYKLGK